MATIASKCTLNTKSIKDKYSALKEMEDGKTKSQVAAKYAIPKNTLSTCLLATKKGSNDWGRALLQTWIKQFLNGSWLFKTEMQLFRL